MRWLPALACVLALGVSGCSGEEDAEPSGDDRRASTPTQAQVATGLGELFSATSPESTDAAGCFGDRLADSRTVGQLTDDGVVDDTGTVVESLPPLTREAAAAWVDAWFSCIDFTEVAGRAQKKVTKTLAVAPFETCFRDRLTDDEIREAATDGLSGDTTSTAVRRLSRAQVDCAELHD